MFISAFFLGLVYVVYSTSRTTQNTHVSTSVLPNIFRPEVASWAWLALKISK